MRRNFQAEDCRLGDSGKAHGTPGEGNPVVKNTEGNYLECKSCNYEIIFTYAQRWDANQRPKQATQNDCTNYVDQKRTVEIESHERSNVCADSIERGVGDGKQPCVTSNQIQRHRQDDIYSYKYQYVQEVFHRLKPRFFQICLGQQYSKNISKLSSISSGVGVPLSHAHSWKPRISCSGFPDLSSHKALWLE